MKTNELIKQVEAMGLSVRIIVGRIRISNGEGLVATASENKILQINTGWKNFGTLTGEVKTALFRLLTEYAKTPIDEREPEKKYQFEFKGICASHRYLNLTRGQFIFNNDARKPGFQTTFIQTEIDDFPDDIKRLITVAERIEVEQDE